MTPQHRTLGSAGGLPSRLFLTLSLGLALAVPGLQAQQAPATPATGTTATPTKKLKPQTAADTAALEEKDDETVVLSPFVVSASDDNGYAATSSLSGTRLKTPLQDIASQVEIFTPEFLEDVAATTIEEALVYSTNTETSLDYAGAGEGDSQGLNSDTRIRGLGSVTKLRGLFRTQIDPEAYNTERLSLSSGPNSILFGLGNAGGTLDSSLKRARLTNPSQTVSYRLDNNGSERVTLDVNQPIIRNKLGIRLAALNSERAYDREPSGDRDRRFYGTFTLRPFANTEIRYYGEWQNADGTRTSLNLARDSVTPWLQGVDGIEGTADDRPLFNNSVSYATSAAMNTALTGLGLGRILSGNVSSAPLPTYTYGNTSGTPGIYLYGSLANTQGPQNAAGVLSYDAFARSLNRPDIIQQEGVNLWGLSRRDEIRAGSQQIYLEQKILDNLLLEVAYATERYNTRSGGYTGNTGTQTAVEIEADANQFIRTPAGVVTANPNAGRLYIEESPLGTVTRSNYHEFRSTLAYSLNLTKRSDWMRWLGRHSLALAYSDALTEDVNQSFRRFVGGSPSWTSSALAQANGIRAFNVRYYLDEVGSADDQGRYFVTNPTTSDVLETTYFADPVTGSQLPVYMFDSPNGGWRNANGKRQSIESKILGLQSYFFGDRLILNGGLRNDKVRNANLISLTNPSLNINAIDPATGFFPRYDTLGYDNYSFYEGKSKASYGAVLHPFKTTRFLKQIRFHYSHSENYKVNEGGQFGPFGDLVPTGVGVGEDYGFTITGADDSKYSLRVNFFTNTQENNRPPNEFNIARRALLNIEEHVINLNNAVGITTPLEGVDIKTFGQNNYVGTSDYESKGVDVTLKAQPIKALKLAFSVGRAHATDSNIMLPWDQWADARLPIWQSVAGGGWEIVKMSPFLGGTNGNKTIKQYFLDAWESVYSPIRAQSGRDRANSREWRVNLHADYSFNQGRLKGLSVGGGGRWQSANVIGYGVTTDSFGQTVIDLNQPVSGEDTLSVDANLTYRMRGLPFLGGKYKSRFQINARNLLGNGDLVGTRALTNGSPGVLAFKPQRQILASITLDF